MPDRLDGFDFTRHNVDVAAVWSAYRAGHSARVPIILGLNTRYFILHPEANPQGVDFQGFANDPDVMFEAQLRFQSWSRFNVLQDAELGLPETWQIHVDFQNYYEAAWFGCPIETIGGQVPDTRPAFGDCPERVMEKGLADPFGGFMARGLEYYERFQDRAQEEEYCGRPISVCPPWFGIGSDGPFTVACNLFGADVVCVLMATDEALFHAIMEFITCSTVQRMAAWRNLAGVPIPQDDFVISDDSIALISVKMYRDHVLPYHRRIYNRFATRFGRGIHLCGDSTRHFPTLRDELNITMFDTGFPVDFARLREQVGPEVRIQGGPNVELLRSATPTEVFEETRRILESGISDRGPFVLREGNNLAPGTPLENTEAMYRAGRQFGVCRRETCAA